MRQTGYCFPLIRRVVRLEADAQKFRVSALETGTSAPSTSLGMRPPAIAVNIGRRLQRHDGAIFANNDSLKCGRRR